MRTVSSPITNDTIPHVPFSSPCRGVLNTPHKRFRQKTNAAIPHVSFSSPCRGVLNTPYKRFRQKTNAATPRVPFSSPCRGVLNTPHRRFWQKTNAAIPTYHFRPQSRTPQSHAYHFRTRVGAYCIRPTDVFGRKRTPCICVIHFRMYAGFVRFRVIRARVHETVVRFCTYSPRSGSFVGRMQYAPTRGRKRYAQDVVICARVHETFVRFLLFIDI